MVGDEEDGRPKWIGNRDLPPASNYKWLYDLPNKVHVVVEVVKGEAVVAVSTWYGHLRLVHSYSVMLYPHSRRVATYGCPRTHRSTS